MSLSRLQRFHFHFLFLLILWSNDILQILYCIGLCVQIIFSSKYIRFNFAMIIIIFFLLFKINFTKTIINIILQLFKLFQVIVEIIWNTCWWVRYIVFKQYDYIEQKKHTKIITMRISLNNLQMRISSKKAYYQLHNTREFLNSYLS